MPQRVSRNTVAPSPSSRPPSSPSPPSLPSPLAFVVPATPRAFAASPCRPPSLRSSCRRLLPTPSSMFNPRRPRPVLRRVHANRPHRHSRPAMSTPVPAPDASDRHDADTAPSPPSPPQPPAATTAPPPLAPSPAERDLAQRLESARERHRTLDARLQARLLAAALRYAQAALPEPYEARAAAARRLRRDLRTLRAGAVRELDLARLGDLQAELERAAVAADDDAPQHDALEGDARDGAAARDALVGDASATTVGGGSAADDAAPLAGWRSGASSLRRTVVDVGSLVADRVSPFMRDDGSIDVDGLRTFVRRLLDSVAMTWMRLNGRSPPVHRAAVAGEPPVPDDGENDVVVVAKPDSLRDTDKEFALREEIGRLEKELVASSRNRETALRREDQLGKLIRAKEIRQMDDDVSALRRTLAVRVLQLELEKIFVSVADEIDGAEYDMILDQRVLVVEFSELDERLATLDLFVLQGEPLLIEDDTLGELAADIQDLKNRLGLDAQLYSSADLNWAQVQQFLTSSSKKTREGVDFYSRGLRLFFGDVRFVLRLVRRAVTGYTPTPREIRTLRRTGSDLLTLVPFTIVLIAPLTPVGHVLIFSFLQRYWPEFFPSTFSERRQAVMKRHEEYLRVLEAEGADSTMDDEDGGNGSGGSGRRGGVLGSIKRLVLFGVSGNPNVRAVEAEGASRNGTSGNGSEEADVFEGSGVALSDLAEQVRDSEKMARKKRSVMALDELHLAD